MPKDHYVTKGYIRRIFETKNQDLILIKPYIKGKKTKGNASSADIFLSPFFFKPVEENFRGRIETPYLNEYDANIINFDAFSNLEKLDNTNSFTQNLLNYVAMSACFSYTFKMFENAGLSYSTMFEKYDHIRGVKPVEKFKTFTPLFSENKWFKIIKLDQPLKLIGNASVLRKSRGCADGFTSSIFPITLEYIFVSGWYFDHYPSTSEIERLIIEQSSEVAIHKRNKGFEKDIVAIAEDITKDSTC